MRVRIKEISTEGNFYEINRVEGIDEVGAFTLDDPVDASCTLIRKGDDKVVMKGRLTTSLSISCDRCLEMYDQAISVNFELLFETKSEASWHLKDLECHTADLDTVLLDEPIIDLDDIFRQQILLSLPTKNLCSEKCLGICTQCGKSRNVESCICNLDKKESPFAVLAQLKKKND